MSADDPAAADPARRRLLQKSSSFRFPSFPSLSSTTTAFPLQTPPDPATPSDDIRIDDAHLPHLDDDNDIYRWAVLYENQRGITLFSTPFYSTLSLLPSDPRPFTIPHNHIPRAHHPNLSLDNYPLPDGTWRWVSAAWMIDMRTDLGEVQHDGFEYNWSFRQHNWHAKIGKLGAGAWVRRRRWVRLMMRPATLPLTHEASCASLAHSPSKLSLLDSDLHPPHTWDGSEQDWQHVHRLLRLLGRDGRKLELWRMWLAPYAHTLSPDIKGKARQPDTRSLSQNALKQRLSDVVAESNPPPLVHLATIFRNHGDAIFHAFVFPDSRAQFLGLVKRTGLEKDLENGLRRVFSSTRVDFWSYKDQSDYYMIRV